MHHLAIDPAAHGDVEEAAVQTHEQLQLALGGPGAAAHAAVAPRLADQAREQALAQQVLQERVASTS